MRNGILIDIQGDDVLMQIFTAPVLQADSADEAPFLEFIQRVCGTDECTAEAQLQPGCGGFGIRNFITLFLSIEVTLACGFWDPPRDVGRIQESSLPVDPTFKSSSARLLPVASARSFSGLRR